MSPMVVSHACGHIAAGVVILFSLEAGLMRAQPAVANLSTRQGELRIGNKTSYPIRVVVTKADGSLEGAFWDFAPGEGSLQGVRLALDDKPLVMVEGDVITVFSVDGSRRYWGPNILGKTGAPFWDSKRRVWNTVLRP